MGFAAGGDDYIERFFLPERPRMQVESLRCTFIDEK